MALCYDVCVYILYYHRAISFGNRPGQSLQIPCVDRTETTQPFCSHRVIFTPSAQKLHDARGMSLRVPYDYLKSLRSFLGVKRQSKILRRPNEQRAMPAWGQCDLPAMCLRATGLRFFKICHSAKLNHIVEATMPVNP